MLSVQAGELYRVKSELAFSPANRTVHAGDLHLVTSESLLVITTLCKGAVFTWYINDFLSGAERVEEGS